MRRGRRKKVCGIYLKDGSLHSHSNYYDWRWNGTTGVWCAVIKYVREDRRGREIRLYCSYRELLIPLLLTLPLEKLHYSYTTRIPSSQSCFN